MADVESFTNWALAQGVTLNGIAALRRPGTGVGFIAERTIEVCAVICFFLSYIVLCNVAFIRVRHLNQYASMT
jgi:hypothetical protein